MKALLTAAFALTAGAAAAHTGHGAPVDHAHWEIAALALVALVGLGAWKLRG